MIIYMNKNLIIFFIIVIIAYVVLFNDASENFSVDKSKCESLPNITIKKICNSQNDASIAYGAGVAYETLVNNILSKTNPSRLNDMFNANTYINNYDFLNTNFFTNNLQKLLSAVKSDVFDTKAVLAPLDNNISGYCCGTENYGIRRIIVLNRIMIYLSKIKRNVLKFDDIFNILLYPTILYFSFIGIDGLPQLLNSDADNAISTVATKKATLDTYMLTQKELLDKKQYDQVEILSNPNYKKLVIIFYNILENILGYDTKLYTTDIPLEYISYSWLVRNWNGSGAV
jgi:hypothetical protein